MMVGKRYYSENDMLRMQREAETRVREMQNRSRRVMEQNGQPAYSGSGGNANAFRAQNRSRLHEAPNPQAAAPRYPGFTHAAGAAHGAGHHPPGFDPAHPPASDPAVAPHPSGQEDGVSTILQDIMKAVGLDEDRLLIIGMLLILINQKADNTLILALCYMLL